MFFCNTTVTALFSIGPIFRALNTLENHGDSYIDGLRSVTTGCVHGIIRGNAAGRVTRLFHVLRSDKNPIGLPKPESAVSAATPKNAIGVSCASTTESRSNSQPLRRDDTPPSSGNCIRKITQCIHFEVAHSRNASFKITSNDRRNSVAWRKSSEHRKPTLTSASRYSEIAHRTGPEIPALSKSRESISRRSPFIRPPPRPDIWSPQFTEPSPVSGKYPEQTHAKTRPCNSDTGNSDAKASTGRMCRGH